MEVIDSPLNESPIFDSPFNERQISDTYNQESSEALTYPSYDYLFESLEPLGCGEGKPIEYDISPSPLPFPLVHHLESSSSKSLIPFGIYSSDHALFPFYEYGVKEEAFIEYTLYHLTHRQDYDHSATTPPRRDHHVKRPIFCIPSFSHPLFPSHHNHVAFSKHDITSSDCDEEFLRVIIHSSILYLEGEPWTSRMTIVLSPRTFLYLKWRSCFRASHPPHLPCDYVHIPFGGFYMSTHTSRHMYIDVMICWLHWLYDYT